MTTKLYATNELKKIREKMGYDQQQMADLLTLEGGRNVSVSAYQKWESGTLNLTAERAVELAKILKVNPKELVRRR